MSEHIGLKNAVRLLQAIEAKIAELPDQPTLETARAEAQRMVDEADTLSPDQKAILRDFIKEYLKQRVMPTVGQGSNG